MKTIKYYKGVFRFTNAQAKLAVLVGGHYCRKGAYKSMLNRLKQAESIERRKASNLRKVARIKANTPKQMSTNFGNTPTVKKSWADKIIDYILHIIELIKAFNQIEFNNKKSIKK